MKKSIKGKAMFIKRTIRFLPVLLLILFISIPLTNCKKQSTTPDVSDLTRPVIWLNYFKMAFATSEVGPNPSSKILQVKNSGQQTLDYTLTDDADWLSFSPESGASTGQIIEHAISINKEGLTAQDEDYTATITITSSQAYNNPQTVSVNLNVTKEPPAEIWVSTKKMSFSAQERGADPSSQKIKIKNSGQGTLRYDISTDATWLEVNPDNGTSKTGEKTHTVSVDIAGLKEGTYDGTITVTDSNATNSPQTVSVSLKITKEPPPEIWVSKNSLSFEATIGGSNPPSPSIFIKNSGGGTLSYNITWDASWMSVSPTSGTSQGAERKHTVSVNIGGLSAGTHNGTITITDPKATNSPQQVNVTLEISEQPPPPPPPPPPTTNEVGISISPSSGPTGTIVTLTIFVDGNTSEISSAFGLELNYNTSIFQYLDTSAGDLTGSWAAVDGGASGGTITVGGFRGSGSIIPVSSQGSIAVVRLSVIYSGSSQSTQITLGNLVDDLVGMTINPGSVWFTYTP